MFNGLKRLDLLNDKKFAQWWIGQRLQFKLKSKRELFSELRIKGIDKNTIEDAIAGVEIDEVQVAKRLIEKKKYRWEKMPKLEARKKMSQFLARKGFKWEVVKEVVDIVLEKK